MGIKLTDSIGFRFASTFVVSAVVVSIIAIIFLYINQKQQLEEKIAIRGNSILSSYVKNSHDSIAKGQRKTFQSVMDSVANVDGIESTSLFTRGGLMTYKSGVVTVGKPFVKDKNNTFVNTNEELYKSTDGTYLRSDWSYKDAHESQNAQEHIAKYSSENKSCKECHFVLDKSQTFKNNIAYDIDDHKSHFYYQMQVKQECISCHTNWKIGESAGVLGLTIENTKDVEEVKHNIYSMATILLVIVGIICIVSILLTKVLINKLGRLKQGIQNLVDSKSSTIIVDTQDEIGEIANLFNKYNETIQQGLVIDAKMIDETKRVTEAISLGNLNTKITKDANNKSLNELKHLINDMINKLNTNIGKDINEILSVLHNYQKLNFVPKVKNASGDIEKTINSLSTYISQMLLENKQNGLMLEDNSNHLKDNVQVLTKSVNQQAISLEQTAASLEEITANVKQNTTKAIDMNTLALTLKESVNNGHILANETANAMEEINHSTTDINSAITVIDQIAFQTNILSLNAAVEAATAGEAGRGFAVVAGEVRNLANRSSEAAKQIKDLVQNASNLANEGKNKSTNMILGYDSINEKINHTIELISEVSQSSKEQLSGLEQINNAISALDVVTQDNTSIAHKTENIALDVFELSKKLVDEANKKEFDGKYD